MTTRTAASIEADILRSIADGTLTRNGLETLVAQASVTNPSALPGATTMFWSGWVGAVGSTSPRDLASALSDAAPGRFTLIGSTQAAQLMTGDILYEGVEAVLREGLINPLLSFRPKGEISQVIDIAYTSQRQISHCVRNDKLIRPTLDREI